MIGISINTLKKVIRTHYSYASKPYKSYTYMDGGTGHKFRLCLCLQCGSCSNYLDGVHITFYLFLLELLTFAERFCDFWNLGPAPPSIYMALSSSTQHFSLKVSFFQAQSDGSQFSWKWNFFKIPKACFYSYNVYLRKFKFQLLGVI